MAVTTSPSAAREIRFVLIVGAACKRYPGGNIPVPEGVNAYTFATAKALELASPTGQWVIWTSRGAPIIFPAPTVQRIETEYLDGY